MKEKNNMMPEKVEDTKAIKKNQGAVDSKSNKAGRRCGKKCIVLNIVVGILLVLVATISVFSYFGGFSTGECADTEEFAKYAMTVQDITIPDDVRVIAFGEATHGNVEFQELKLDVFKTLVEKYDVKAFTLEGDFGGCEVVNRYIHGGDGTAKEAAASIGFAIYRTDQMAELIQWMREYNETAEESQDIRFYGFDMQRIDYNYKYLIEEAKSFGIDTAELESMWDEQNMVTKSGVYNEERMTEILRVRSELEKQNKQLAVLGIHFADILIQNINLGKVVDNAMESTALRDEYMADNIMWILEQEEQRGHTQIFVSGHNGHIEKHGTYAGTANPVTGAILYERLGDEYFAIGSDFYKARVNLPGTNDSREKHTFFSHDPLANASNEAGYDISYLDFNSVPQDSALRNEIDGYIWEGSLGEGYSPLMSVIPMSYRTWRSPSDMYDAMIYVSYAHPTDIYILE